MKYISDLTNVQLNNTAVALGKFDGMHNGHMLLINKLKELKKNGEISVICSFDMGKPGILTNNEKKYLAKKNEADVFINYKFTKEFAMMSPEDFIKDILVTKLGASTVVVGDDFRFGHNREGDVSTLMYYAEKYGYKLFAFDKYKMLGEDVSSTRIRESLLRSDVKTANLLLGYNYFIFGEVCHGRHLGSTIGFPTVNLKPDDTKLLLPDGVYATRVIYKGCEYPSITNIGNNPTVAEDNQKTIETHIIDFDMDLYGEQILVEFIDFIRSEKKFNSIQHLTEQLCEDIIVAKQLFI